MTKPPNIVTDEKLLELFNRHTFQQKIQRCDEHRTVEPQNPWLDSQRKKELVRYIDVETNEEVGLVAIYTDNPPGTNVQRIILRLSVDNEIYELKRL